MLRFQSSSINNKEIKKYLGDNIKISIALSEKKKKLINLDSL